jgi:hypothetical protein
MRRGNGGVIGKLNAPTTTSAQGVWSPSEIQEARQAGIWPSLLLADEYFNRVTLLLPGNGTNGAQNNTFLDSSTNNFTVTRNGNPTQGTFSPFSHTGWSNYFDGSGDYLGNTSTALITQNVSTFTIEGWIYMSANPTSDGNNISGFITVDGQPAGTVNYLAFGPISSRVLYLRWFDGTGKTANGSTTLNLNQWYHIACVVNSNAIQFYVNGAAETMSGTTTLTNRNGTTGNFSVGSHYYGAISGYLSNVRVTTTAVYTAAFTPPTSPLTAITNPSLLTCQSNRFIDNSSNAYALTVGGTPSVQAFSPFAPTAPYSAATVGGSGYYDGSGDYLQIANSSALTPSGNFTIEFWAYALTAAGVQEWYSKGYGIQIYVSGSNWGAALSSGNNSTYFFITAVTPVIPNTWTHLALTRNGNDYRFFINGVLSGSTSSSSAPSTSTDPLRLGEWSVSTGYPITGYMSSVRYIDGTALYTSNFTPPTSPPTAVTNTQLLVNFTNAGITDATAKSDLETLGNAQISTAQSKFGGSSIAFDGTGDYLTSPNNQWVTFGTSDFTMEAWIYWNTLDSGSAIFWGSGVGWTLYIYPNNKLQWGRTTPQSPVNLLTGNTTLATGQWYHIAVTRASGTVRLFVNGVVDGSISDTADYNAAGALQLGISHSNNFLNGYVDDLRITKGFARYTANFTPPTLALPIQ